ncbi:hypothetical protein BJX96DRAFT_154084 [Aspergillus floccosus]
MRTNCLVRCRVFRAPLFPFILACMRSRCGPTPPVRCIQEGLCVRWTNPVCDKPQGGFPSRGRGYVPDLFSQPNGCQHVYSVCANVPVVAF